MFSLIITIISIALVAALALASIYYGGTAFNRNSTEIKAAEIMLQQQQIRAAMSLYKVDNEGKAPKDLQELVQGNYLRQVPTYVANSNSLSPTPLALAADAIEWVMPAQYIGTFVLAKNVSDNVCAEVNFKTRAVRGVPNQLYTSQLPVQCFFSADKNTNIVIVTDDSATVSNALTGTNITPTQPSNPFTLPASEINTTDQTLPTSDPSKWKIAPSSSGSSGGSGGSGGEQFGAVSYDSSVICFDCTSTLFTSTPSATSFRFNYGFSIENILEADVGKSVKYTLAATNASMTIGTCYPVGDVTCSIEGNTVTLTPTAATSSATAYLDIQYTPAADGNLTASATLNGTDSRLSNNSVTTTRPIAGLTPVDPLAPDVRITCAAQDCDRESSTGVEGSLFTRTYLIEIKNSPNASTAIIMPIVAFTSDNSVLSIENVSSSGDFWPGSPLQQDDWFFTGATGHIENNTLTASVTVTFRVGYIDPNGAGHPLNPVSFGLRLQNQGSPSPYSLMTNPGAPVPGTNTIPSNDSTTGSFSKIFL